MLIHVGYEFGFDAPLPVVMLLKLYLHPSILNQVRQSENLQVEPATKIEEFLDSFGNRTSRLIWLFGNCYANN